MSLLTGTLIIAYNFVRGDLFMTKSELFSTLNDINFAEKNADIIESEIIS